MKVVKGFFRRSFNVITLSKRSLFNQDILGLTAFKDKRVELLASDKSENFLMRIQEICEDPSRRLLSHHIKQVPFCVKTAEDSVIVEKALEKYAKDLNPTRIVFQNFSTGPEIMRMYHFLNLPIEGLSVLQNPITTKLFNDIKSYFIMQDLLYNNGMFNEVCELFKILEDKELHGRELPFLNYIIFQAACYKMNTSNSYEDAMQTFEKFIKYYKRPVWPIIMYTVIFALENGVPDLALKYPLGKDRISDNIKLAALIKTGEKAKALEYFETLVNKATVIQSVASELYNNLQNPDDSNLSSTKSEISKKNIGINSFKNQSFDELAAETIHSLNSLSFRKNNSSFHQIT